MSCLLGLLLLAWIILRIAHEIIWLLKDLFCSC
jgi:hypothetical protein